MLSAIDHSKTADKTPSVVDDTIRPRIPKFQYYNREIHQSGRGKHVVRTVKIRNGKGHKTVKLYLRKRCRGTAKRQLTEDEIHKIHNRQFITGLFNDCKICNIKTKSR